MGCCKTNIKLIFMLSGLFTIIKSCLHHIFFQAQTADDNLPDLMYSIKIQLRIENQPVITLF